VDQRLTLVTLGVRDLVASRRFYLDGLGWRAVLDVPEVVFVQVGPGVLLGLFDAAALETDVGSGRAPGDAATAPVTLAHNVASEREVDDSIARAVGAGARVLKPAQRAEWGGYHGYVADPDGFRWEIAYNPGLVFDADGTARFTGG
jgi:hypothetical protein